MQYSDTEVVGEGAEGDSSAREDGEESSRLNERAPPRTPINAFFGQLVMATAAVVLSWWCRVGGLWVGAGEEGSGSREDGVLYCNNLIF